jgi:chromosome segregation ATPase
MAVSSLIFALLLVCPSQAAVQDDAKNRPVSKVITLLKDMVAQLDKEAKEDEEVYEEMQCWCTTNDKELTKSIGDAQTKIGQLGTAIEEFTANSARLNTEIENLDAELAKNSDALDTATSLRKKQLAEFNAEEKSNLQTIASLKSAVVALSKHHEASFLEQQSSSGTMEFLSTIAGVHGAVRKNADMMSEMFTSKQRNLLSAFLESPDAYLSKQLSLLQAPASGEIFGMLKQMKESFETNVANAQAEEMKNDGDFQELSKTKKEQIAAATAQIDTKTQELAATDEKNAQSKEDLENTQGQLASDTAFLAEVQEKCAGMDAEYMARTQDRQLEIQAVSKALAFLSSDDAHDLFSKTLNFAQVKSTQHSKRRNVAVKLLKDASKKFQDPKLALLATKARLDAFTEVKKDIQKMIDTLTQEKADEIKLKDFCVAEFNTNQADTEAKERDHADATAKIEDLTSAIDTLSKELEVLKSEVAELKVQMKRAGEDREKMNAEFQVTVADQRATQKLLTAALDVLKGFYEKSALIQKSSSKQPAFKEHKRNENSGGVMGMIGKIVSEAKGLEAETIRAEEDAQKAYEEFTKNSNDSADAKTRSIISKGEMKGKAEKDKVETEQSNNAILADLEALANAKADLHSDCDFTLKNFDLRQGARDSEIEALKQCLSIFSGASFSALLEVDGNDEPGMTELDKAFNGI